MNRIEGKPMPLGVTVEDGKVNFSVAVQRGKVCQLLLYHTGVRRPVGKFELSEEDAVGEVRYLALTDLEPESFEYNYCIDGQVVIDPYVKELAGREIWGKARNIDKNEVRGKLVSSVYDWEDDKHPCIPDNEVIAYSLHVRGYTKHPSAQVEFRGTFQGITDKLSYIKSLGVNQIQCMPVYEFEENTEDYTNYWGYGSAYWFAPKSSFDAYGNGVKGLKDMVKAYHKEGMEVVLYLPFHEEADPELIVECLRYYMLEYHIDGFLLNPYVAPMETIRRDPLLKGMKILKHNEEFQNTMRRFLKGDEGMVTAVMQRLRHLSQKDGNYNYITTHTGFTLNDLVSYDNKHNDENGENNMDGPSVNYSWNCGAEGPTRKKTVNLLRGRQIRNAFALLMTAQGTPCILAGDEFGNSQKGNNNVYCQDNEAGWLNWRGLQKTPGLHEFVQAIIQVRKEYPVFCQSERLLGMDQLSCGIPDVSYHGEYAWQIQDEYASRQLGVYYSGASLKTYDCFVGYNMHWIPHLFALPILEKGKVWVQILSTETGMIEEQILENQKEIMVNDRTIVILAGKPLKTGDVNNHGSKKNSGTF